MYEYVILVTALAGIVINVGAFVLISKKRSRSMFHHLLKILMVYDCVVVICCMLKFALPFIWKTWYRDVRRYILPWLLPGMHIAVMSSVYSTVLISFERFIRICYYCQLQFTTILTEENIKYYKTFVVIFPVVFYIPKFFEIRTHPQTIPAQVIDCGQYMTLAGQFQNPLMKDFMLDQFEPDQISKIQELAQDCVLLNYGPQNSTLISSLSPTTTESRLSRWGVLENFVQNNRDIQSLLGQELSQLRGKRHASQKSETAPRTLQQSINDEEASLSQSKQAFDEPENRTRLTLQEKKAVVRYLMLQRQKAKAIQNVTVPERTKYSIEPTSLRMNKYYYRIYYVFLNTLFASVLPFVLLVYLNIRTALALFKMGEGLESSPVLGQPLFTVKMDDGDDGSGAHMNNTCVTILNHDGGRSPQDCYGTDLFTPNDSERRPSRNKGDQETGVTVDEEQQPLVNYSAERRKRSSAQPPATRPITNGQHSTLLDSITTVGQNGCSPSSPSSPNRQKDGKPVVSRAQSKRQKSFRNSISEVLARHSSVLRARRDTNLSSHEPAINKNREKRMGYISLWIVWLFLFCHIWKLVPTAYEVIMSKDDIGLEIADWPHWVEIIEKLSHTLITLNSSVNFLIYLVL
ncbi:hypothetical protein TCAL_14009 [Tigriopus californicus]|uniref:G-protein coupled receptors family 1 profile domain-containing protein n=1 Tax=Tigriopus californicus TaxID=6832 RepID=A0A553PJX9_TIGCA|nr:uncharacterized protein LOC131890529 [Tigriopus californicus]XP_059095869.1 uncharacterized protein LOC131890529 [Tigriopus californicus]XP_059095871.1 uncharacterized protein LOC131890529 [Tigriopus californicus]TRY77986.1 hypothetical protein TCAL_14009 [Tigriopus californicus]|eukprot:TCALIF_14009-PA protein Name:"Similar to FR FMRFamide receptor (Drosophila melanogaster)" AED:0.00 eAED:0.00 QI:214/1/1/1/1/1/2/528/631